MPLPKPKLSRPSGRWFATVALLLAAAAVAVIVVSNNGSPSHNAGAGTTATGAVAVQRRNLVASDTESGTLSYANQQTVYNRLSGTVTWVPKVGQVIKPGHTLFTVDNKPVLLMNGSTPAYRDLTAADVSGPDVFELNRNLVALGYDPDGIVIDDKWQSATTAGIDVLQHDLGETETGTLTLGQVVFLPGPQMIQSVSATVGSTVANHEPAASSAEFVDYSNAGTTGTTTTGGTTTGGTTTGGTTTGGTSTGTGTTPAAATGTGTTPSSGSATPPRTGNRGPGRHHRAPTRTGKHGSANGSDNLSRQTLQQLLRLVQEQQRELQAEQRASHSPGGSSGGNPSNNGKGNGGHSGNGNSGNGNSGNGNSGSGAGSGHGSNPGGNGGGGSGGGSATAVLSTSSTKLVVTVDLGASSQSEARIGEHVTVDMPNGTTAGGRITAVSPVAQSSGSGGGGGGGGSTGGSGSGNATVPVTIVLNRPARGGGLDQASVSVNFVQSKARNVLSVPVTALLATSGSSFAVQQAAAPHKLVPVHTGLFAAGYVAISGQGIHPGLKVTDSQG